MSIERSLSLTINLMPSPVPYILGAIIEIGWLDYVLLLKETTHYGKILEFEAPQTI